MLLRILNIEMMFFLHDPVINQVSIPLKVKADMIPIYMFSIVSKVCNSRFLNYLIMLAVIVSAINNILIIWTVCFTIMFLSREKMLDPILITNLNIRGSLIRWFLIIQVKCTIFRSFSGANKRREKIKLLVHYTPGTFKGYVTLKLTFDTEPPVHKAIFCLRLL